MPDLARILVLAFHLVCMNVAAGAPLVCVWLEWRSRKNREPLASQAADYLARWSVLALLAGTVVGLLLGAMLWSEPYRQLWLVRLWHKMTWGLAELGCSLAAMAGYWLWRSRRTGAGTATAALRILLLLFAATNLLYHFPPLFLVAARLADAGASAGEPVTPAMFRQEMFRGEVPALATHFVLASLAMTGMMLLGLALRLKRCGAEEDGARLARWGGRIAFVPTLLQLPVGVWVLSTVSSSAQNRLMGSQLSATFCFLLSLALALWLLRELAVIALGEHERGQLVRAMALMVAVVVLMTASQRLAQSPRSRTDEQPAISISNFGDTRGASAPR